MSSVTLLAASPRRNIEQIVVSHVARIGSPNEGSAEYGRLLAFLIEQGHWSPFEFAHFVYRVQCPFYVAAQIKRHRSIDVQEYSARYFPLARATDFPPARLKPTRKHPQRANVLASDDDQAWFARNAEQLAADAFAVYEEGLERGIAPEVMRSVLPLQTETVLLLRVPLRTLAASYAPKRLAPDTQAEHRDVATRMVCAVRRFVPAMSAVLGWDALDLPDGAVEYDQDLPLAWD